MQEHSATSPSESTPQLSNYLINLQHFSTTQFKARLLVHTRALLALIEGMGYDLEERLAPAERPGQLDLSVVAYLQIVSELPSDRVVVLKFQEFNSLVSKIFAKLYPAVALYTRPRPVTFEDLLEPRRPRPLQYFKPRASNSPDSCSPESLGPKFTSPNRRSLQNTPTHRRAVRRSN